MAPATGSPTNSPNDQGTSSIPIRRPTTSKEGQSAASITAVAVVIAPAKKPPGTLSMASHEKLSMPAAIVKSVSMFNGPIMSAKYKGICSKVSAA
ncbi:MAG: hypothetical protein Q9190_006899 [Brigantiaea leucoxantha]